MMPRTHRALACVLFASLLAHAVAQAPRRSIERCAQDGAFFYGVDDSSFGSNDKTRLGKPVSVQRDGAFAEIIWTPTATTLNLSYKDHRLSVISKELDPTLGYLTTSAHRGFALDFSPNASAWSTQLFVLGANGLQEDKTLIQSAEQQFELDAKRVCKEPGVNTEAIKWIDDYRLLVAINAWSTGTCSSNYTEGFILNVGTDRIERKLSNAQLINLPAICTWNIVPISPSPRGGREPR